MGAPKLGEEKLIPRSRADWPARAEELRRLYVDDRKTTVEIAAIFGCATHKSVIRALEKWGIPRRSVGSSRYVTCCEEGCELPIFRVKHKGNGSMYGRRCRLHWVAFRMAVCYRWYDKTTGIGGDEQWLRRMRQSLARARRINREVSQSLNTESRPATTSPGACPH